MDNFTFARLFLQLVHAFWETLLGVLRFRALPSVTLDSRPEGC